MGVLNYLTEDDWSKMATFIEARVEAVFQRHGFVAPKPIIVVTEEILETPKCLTD